MLATLSDALVLLVNFDHRLLEIVGLSLRVSLSALLIGILLGLPLGALLAVSSFPGRGAVNVALNALMGLPSVVVGVLVYLALSRSGPFGSYGLLFSPRAMVIAQTLLKKTGGGRIAAHEIMIGTPAIRNLIREAKVAQMYSAIQTGQAHGMQTLDQNLKELMQKGLIARKDARSKAQNKDDFM